MHIWTITEEDTEESGTDENMKQDEDVTVCTSRY